MSVEITHKQALIVEKQTKSKTVCYVKKELSIKFKFIQQIKNFFHLVKY